MDREELGRQAWEMRAALLRLAMSILKRPQDAEDAVSDAIVRAFERLDTLRNDAAVRAWLMKITVRCCYERARRSRRESLHEDVEPLCQPVWPREEGALLEQITALPDGERRRCSCTTMKAFAYRTWRKCWACRGRRHPCGSRAGGGACVKCCKRKGETVYEA